MSSIKNFITCADRIVTFEARFKEANHTEGSLDIYKSELQDMWERCRDAYEICLNETSRSDEKDDTKTIAQQKDSDAVIQKYMATFETYALLFGRINELLKTLAHPSVPSSQPVSEVGQHRYGFRLPPCDIDVFKGDYLSWPTFRDLFTAIYIQNPQLSQVEKLYHLLQKTKGDANVLIKKIPLTNEGFELAWKNLMDTYENKRVLTNTQLEIFYKLPTIRSETSESLKMLQRGICGVLEALKLLGTDISTWDPIIVFHCCQRLPEITLTLWEQTLSDKTTIPSWESLNSFLTTRFQTLESVAGMRATTIPQGVSKKVPTLVTKPIRSYHTNVNSPNNVAKCPACPGQSHKMRLCDKFKSMSPLEKHALLKSHNMCINCLCASHVVSDCTSQFNCAVCQRRHHTWLHFKASPSPHKTTQPANSRVSSNATLVKTEEESASTSAASQVVTMSAQSFHQLQEQNKSTPSNGAPKQVLLGTAIVLIDHLGTTYPARALIDSASEVSFVTNALRSRLGLRTRQANVTVSGVNNQVTASTSKLCSFILSSSINSQIQIECNAFVLPRITGNLPSFSLEAVDSRAISNLQLADGEFYKSAPIDILIGGDLYASVVLGGVQHNVFGSLIAQETVFGWILTGHLHLNQICSYATTVSTPTETALDVQLRQFWEIEEVPQKKHLSASDKHCEELFQRTTHRNSNGRFVVSLPFKKNFNLESSLGASRPTVLRQFLRNEAHLLKKPAFKTTYDSVLQEYHDLDHMECVPPPKIDEYNSCYYLPHHSVVKPESTTTSLRVVFNASCSTSNGQSLNDMLHTGPVLQADLTFLLLRWRMYRYVFNSDITKMYRQILVEPSQRKFQRILFRSNFQDPVQDFELKTVTFGVNCAPFLAIRVLHKLAEDVSQTHPLASKILRNNMYVDDVLAGYNDISTARQARDQLIDALQTAGFSLRKWTSNNRCILEGLPQEHLLDESFLQFEESSSSKALGVRWNAIRDEFFFIAQPLQWKDNFTKREVLSIIAKLFDPAGWLSPLIIVAKMIMQQIWLDKTDWDEVVANDTLSRWKEFIHAYPMINQVQIPRWIGYRGDQTVQIHGFCDASEKAYCGAIYLRCEQFGSCFSYLFMAKTRVSPVKTVSLPRLELCGALLLSDMLTSLLAEIKFPNREIFCWTDSTIVLAWLQKPPCSWTTFVANRVTKIQDSVGIECWRHVDSKDNPADLGSRGTITSDFLEERLWWQGPSWLVFPPEEWPASLRPETHTEIEAKSVKTHTVTISPSIDDILNRFSNYSRALHVLAYILRFVKSSRNQPVPEVLEVSATEINEVRTRLIQLSQMQHFAADYQNLLRKASLSNKSNLLTLNPIIDTHGIMRVNGRLVNSQSLTPAEKFPIILPYNSRLSRLFIEFLHSISLHGGNALILRLLRQEIWIPKATILIKTVINRCKTCVLFRHKQSTQMMAALPIERSTISRPFEITGVDFAGPFDIKNYTGRACLITKGYVCVFVCFSTKAIHLEGTTNLTTECFLAAFTRFISRRGCPRKIYSDNGTTFVGASKSLRKDFESTMKDVSEKLVRRQHYQALTWHFIPAGAPHMGGLWEAGVKSFKTHFKKVAVNFKYTFEEFSTLLCRIEACLNSRPLCATSAHTPELSALTPGHFLIGAPLIAPADPLFSEQPMTVVNRWRKLKVLSQHINMRWKEEYLKEMHKRFKWKFPKRDFQVNDLVVVRHEQLPPTEWRLGRVIKIYQARDQRVRIADVRTQKGVITRPIVKLVLLPEDEPQ